MTWEKYILSLLFAGLAAFAIERVLGISKRAGHSSAGRQTWRYRFAFLTGAGLTLILVGILWIFRPGDEQGIASSLRNTAGSVLWLLLMVILGAFFGGLAATGLREKLWEDNSPPPAQIQAEVLDMHRKVNETPSADPWSKRLFDIALAAVGLAISAPVWLVSIFVIWIIDPGPILFVKNSVGKDGRNFHQYKLRSMVRGAEQATGPILAREEDERVLWIGRFLRKTALDELPQLFNILRGDMSFVGPRPQRTVLVHGYLQSMPEYAYRHQVRPGLAGLAQVAGDYYLTPRQKLRFDRLYIRHVSLVFDLKLLLLAFLLVGWYRWQPGWGGRLPRRLLH